MYLVKDYCNHGNIKVSLIHMKYRVLEKVATLLINTPQMEELRKHIFIGVAAASCTIGVGVIITMLLINGVCNQNRVQQN